VIDRQLLPAHGPAGLRALSIYSGEQTAFGQVVARDAALGFPMLFDLDWQVFDRYRIPGGVFPLSVVVGRDGTVVHMDADEDLGAAEAAIVEAL
jgi:hypothetical protein